MHHDVLKACDLTFLDCTFLVGGLAVDLIFLSVDSGGLFSLHWLRETSSSYANNIDKYSTNL